MAALHETDPGGILRAINTEEKMIVSQTGFGRADVEDGDLRFSVEIRSVNNRFLEVGLKLPRSLYMYENDIRSHVRTRVDRGKVNVFIQEDRGNVRQSRLAFDKQSAKALADSLREIAEDTELKIL